MNRRQGHRNSSPDYLGLRPQVHLVKGPAAGALYDLAAGKVWSVPPLFVAALEQCSDGRTFDDFLTEAFGKKMPAGARDLVRRFVREHPALQLTPTVPEAPTAPPLRRKVRLNLLALEITSACNLRCCHCYLNAGGKAARAKSPTLPTARWIELMKEGRAIGFRWLQITGGEPTVHPDLMRLLREAVATGFEEVALFTNFFALGEDVFAFLREAEMEIHTTIFSHQPAVHDAITGLPGSFERVVAGVRRAREAGLEVLVSIVFMDRNDQDRAATLDFVRGLGVPNDCLKVSYVRPQGRGLKLPESTRPPLWDRRMEDWTVEGGEIVATTCWAGKTAIGATGDVYVCVGERTVLGNVATASLRPILKRPAMRKLWKITLDDVPGCSVCEFRYACFDCRADAHLVSNDLLGRDPTCPYDPLTGTWLFKGEPLSMQESNRPKRKENLIVEEMDGDLILADFQTSQMHVLNPIAAAVWDMCDGRQTVEDMAGLLAEHFQVESAQVRPDVERMLEEFRSKGLLE